MKTSDWDDPTIRAIGRRYAADAYDLASELHHYGADAAELIKPQLDPTRPRDVSIPAMLADVLMAVLLTLPGRSELRINPPGRTLQRLGSACRDEVLGREPADYRRAGRQAVANPSRMYGP
jgi:hypothetical protein